MTSALRIVRVMPFFHRRRGGSVAQALATCQELAARGHQIRVVTSDLDQPADVPRDRWLEHAGFQIFYGRIAASGRVVPYWQPALQAPLQHALGDADLACLHVGLTWTNAMARRLARRQGVPYVYNAEGALCPVRLQDKALRKRLFLWLYERRTLRDAAAIQALTAKEATDAVAQGAAPNRVHVIPNGVALPTRPPSREAARQRLGFGGDEFVILFLGRLSAMKGPQVLLDAALPLLAAGNVRLVLAGPDDGMATRLRADAAAAGVGDRVQFPGLVVDNACTDLWCAADVFALPSRSEGLPLGPLEAAAHGLPLLVSPACNLPEVATHNAGAVVAVDALALRRALCELRDDVALRHRRSQNAIAMVATHFSLGAVVDRLERLYEGIARQ